MGDWGWGEKGKNISKNVKTQSVQSAQVLKQVQSAQTLAAQVSAENCNKLCYFWKFFLFFHPLGLKNSGSPKPKPVLPPP